MISVDPGKCGAMVVWHNNLPFHIENNPYEGTRLNIAKVIMLFRAYNPKILVIEDVSTSPKMGVVSAANFLYNLAVFHTAAIANGCEVIRIKPQKWKATMGLYGKPKPYALVKIKEVYPDFDDKHSNKLDRAEAVLIGAAYQKLKKLGGL